MTDPIAGLIQALKQNGVKLDNVALTTSIICVGMRKILFTKGIVHF